MIKIAALAAIALFIVACAQSDAQWGQLAGGVGRTIANPGK